MARRFKHLIPVHLSIIEKIDDSETIIDISYVMLCGEQNNVRFWHKADRLTELKVCYERETDIQNYFLY